jgi:hypothetical protein
VLLQIEGSAVNGADYERISRIITFQPYQSSIIIEITPIANAGSGNKTVEISLVPESGITITNPWTARLLIVKERQTFDTWQLANDLQDSDPLTDTDKDGKSDFVEYAMGFNPNLAESGYLPMPVISIVNGRIQVKFSRPLTISDVDYNIELSKDLKVWEAGYIYMDQIASWIDGNNVTMIYQFKTTSNSSTWFARVNMEFKEDASYEVDFQPDINRLLSDGSIRFNTSGSKSWVSDVTIAGGPAVKSGAISHSQTSVFQTEITGPVVLNFDWKVSSEKNADFLELYIDETLVKNISGEVDWTSEELVVSEGYHRVSWNYTKNVSGSIGKDAGWIRRVSLKQTCLTSQTIKRKRS